MEHCPACQETDPGTGLFCKTCTTHIPGRSFASPYQPTWGVFEPSLHSDDPKTQRSATDLFTTERARELKASEKARRWEKGRKESWAKQKPTFVKQARSL